jgi:hypothetical protein
MLSAFLLFVVLVLLFVGIVGCIFCYLFGTAKAFQPYLKDRKKWEDFKAQLDKVWDEKEKAEKEKEQSNLNC